MTAELQLKEESMGGLVKVPSNQSIRGDKEDESDEYFSNSDSMEETRSETSWSDLSPRVYTTFTTKSSFLFPLFFLTSITPIPNLNTHEQANLLVVLQEVNLPSPKFSLAVEFLRRLHGSVGKFHLS